MATTEVENKGWSVATEREEEAKRVPHSINAITFGDLVWFFFKAYFALAVAAIPYAIVVGIIAAIASH